jgi:hypothetical protein
MLVGSAALPICMCDCNQIPDFELLTYLRKEFPIVTRFDVKYELLSNRQPLPIV